MSAVTLDLVIDQAMQLPPVQQDKLLEILRSRRIEARRAEIANDARESIAAYRTGQLKAQPADSVIAELRRALEDPERENWS